MKRALLICALFLVSATTSFAQAPPQPAASAEAGAVVRETELDRLTKDVAAQLRCVVCQGLSIQDSPSSLAQEMRAVVREQLELGKSPDEVKEYFVEKYGEWVLLRPKAQGFNLVVYILPILMFVGGGFFIYSRARNWTNTPVAPVEEKV